VSDTEENQKGNRLGEPRTSLSVRRADDGGGNGVSDEIYTDVPTFTSAMRKRCWTRKPKKTSGDKHSGLKTKGREERRDAPFSQSTIACKPLELISGFSMRMGRVGAGVVRIF